VWEVGRRFRAARRHRRPPESDCSGMQPQAGGKPHPRLNTGEGPIAKKYREGKMKRTLRRESKALEIAGREALGARRFGPVGMSGGARGRPRSTFLKGASQKRPEAVAASSRITPSIPAGRPASAPQAAGGRGMGPGGRKASSLFLVAGRLVGRRRRGRGARRHAPPFVGAGKGRPGGFWCGRGPGTRRPLAQGRLGRLCHP